MGNYGGETTYNIKDSSDNEVMQGSGWPANSVNSFWKCFSSGSYTFTITDAYGDGICCSYGNGGYSVKVDDKEVASGGDFDSSETKTFDVGSSTPTTPAPVPTTPTTAPFAITSPPSASDSTWDTFSPTTSECYVIVRVFPFFYVSYDGIKITFKFYEKFLLLISE